MRVPGRIVAAALMLAISGAAVGQSASELDRRLTILERKLSSQALTDLVNELGALRDDVSGLRGRMDVVERRLDALKERRRQMYSDLDERLSELEAGGKQPAGADSPAPPSSRTGSSRNEGDTGDAPDQSGASDAETAYQQNFATLRSGDYQAAAKGFEGFLKRYPDSDFADNARYWLGEAHYVVREFDAALANFQRVLDDFPDSPKRSDALLKVGFIQYEQGDREASRKTLNSVIQRFPDSAAAGLAQQRLDRMSG